MQICQFLLFYDYVIVLLQLGGILKLDIIHLKNSVYKLSS